MGRFVAAVAMAMAMAMAMGLASSARAELPCGPIVQPQHTFTFHAPASTNAAPVTGYRMYVTQLPAGAPQLINLGALTPDANGTITFTPSLGFDTSKDFSVQVSATGPGGESAKSDPVSVPATSAGVCPVPSAPAAPSQLALVQ